MPQSLATGTRLAIASAGWAAWPLIVEAVLVAVAIGALLPWFDRIATDDAGRDRRFEDASIAVRGLPDPVLPSLCAAYGSLAEAAVRERLCPRGSVGSGAADLDRMPAALADARVRIRDAFLAPLRDAQTRLADLRLQQREGLGDLLALSNAVEATSAELQPFVDRYMLDGPEGAGPMPLYCAFDEVAGSLAPSPSRTPAAHRDVARANAWLLLGATVDGNPATAALADAALLPVASVASKGRCGTIRLADALAQASVLMIEARQAPLTASKNEAMRALLHSAGWQWAGWMLAGFGLLQLARRSIPPAVGVAIALAVWAVAAWLGHVPWPLSSGRGMVFGREGAWWFAMPAPFVLWMLFLAVVTLAASPWLSKWLNAGPETIASRIGYPGLVLMTGVGWLLLLDLSANGYVGNRYLALYHQGHLWLGMLIFCVLVFLRQPLGRMLAWCLSILDGVASAIGGRVGRGSAAALFVLAILAVVGLVGFLMTNVRQLTSEIGRVWLIAGAAWFFFLRGTPLAERMARSGNSLSSLVRYVGPLLFVVLVLIGTMLVTHDMGPLLIAGYGAGAFVAASIAMWWHQRHGATRSAYGLAVAFFALWILATTYALFELGSIDEVTAGRLENLAAPLASANDQLALVSWFQRASPPAGFGLGSVPWCGYGISRGCAGVPAQIQSDYTFTALVGAFGWTFAWAMTLGCAVWLHRLVRHHGRVTRGEPRFIATQGRVVSDDQALLSWLGVAWVVLALCQLAVTVAGNLAVLPLTGVTFPFVSFGMTSLLVNMAMLALCLHISVPGPADHA